MKRRRSLTHVGGAAKTAGDPGVAERLAAALDVAPAPEPRGGAEADDPDRTHVHGFHTYPARMHPTTAARLVALVSSPGGTLLDPFCGSGTVLVEALIAGRKAIGTDLNPLAVQLARLKTTPRDQAACAALVAAAREVVSFAEERRTRRAGATRRYPPEDVALFDPHVLLELDSLRAGITTRQEASEADAEALGLVLSAILVKVSRRASDTSQRAATRRIAAGYPSRLFLKKTEELVARVATLRGLLPPEVHPARIAVDDASRLATLRASTIDAVVSSPPYVGTYDYLTQHAQRLRWLSADARALAAGEMGSRRRYANLDARAARETWSRELAATLRAMARVCRKGARVVLLMADSGARGEALRADVLVEAEAREAGLDFVARASQERPHFHGDTAAAFRDVPRAEHAIALEKR
jgi:DNA modification methylase